MDHRLSRHGRGIWREVLPPTLHAFTYGFRASSALECLDRLGQQLQIGGAGRVVGVTPVHVLEAKGEPPLDVCLPQQPRSELANMRNDGGLIPQTTNLHALIIDKLSCRLDEHSSTSGLQRCGDVGMVAALTSVIFPVCASTALRRSPGKSVRAVRMNHP